VGRRHSVFTESLKQAEGVDLQPVDDPLFALPRRLRSLRENQWPDMTITQAQLARALGGGRPLSVPLISSWESWTKPVVPPLERLNAYASFFATRRSVEGGVFRLLREDELTARERSRRDELQSELLSLREAALRAAAVPRRQGFVGPPVDTVQPNPWHFDDHAPVTIVCAQLPADLRMRMPYTDPDDPDYIETYTYADLDSVLELHGHVRALNPTSQVNVRLATDLEPDDYATHLAVLGGVDWNTLTRDLLRRLDLPVTQVARDADPDGAFEITEGRDRKEFRPVLVEDGSRRLLSEDIAHFFRGPNPFNRKRTVTMCNGMFGRGVLGAVRALTDAQFRDRNSVYIRDRFRGSESFSILARVPIVNGAVLTPDWTMSENRLHEWPVVMS
jgi:hypothetical protein